MAATAVAVATASAVSAPQPLDSPGEWRSGLRFLQPAGLRPADLDGRIVLVEFWTFGCINCRRTVPAMRALHERLGDRIRIVAIHTPEYDHEKPAAAVRAAIAREKIRFAVAQDNDFRAWRAFGNRWWPALYLLDPQGRIRHRHIGELHAGTSRWDELLRAISRLEAERRP